MSEAGKRLIAAAKEASELLDSEMPLPELLLHMGDGCMSAQEARTARAAIRWANRRANEALAAKDAEIERLRAEVGSLRIAFQVNMLRFGAPGAAISAVLDAAAGGAVSETRQDRRSGVSGHGEPSDTPTGDTRG